MSVIVNPVTNDITVTISSGANATWGQITGKPAVIAEGATEEEARAAIGAGTVESIQGSAVDNTDPRNPVVDSPTAADIGLGLVDNTSDLDKPVSTATAVELAKKLDKLVLPVALVADKNLTQSDNGTLQYTTENPVVITVLTNSVEPSALGTTVNFFQAGAGAITFAAGAGVTLIPKNGALSTTGPGDAATLVKLFANTWALIIGG